MIQRIKQTYRAFRAWLFHIIQIVEAAADHAASVESLACKHTASVELLKREQGASVEQLRCEFKAAIADLQEQFEREREHVAACLSYLEASKRQAANWKGSFPVAVRG